MPVQWGRRTLGLVSRPFQLDPDLLVQRAVSATGLGEFTALLPKQGHEELGDQSWIGRHRFTQLMYVMRRLAP
jgi:hypothetical protein